jgi:hypothetical protein
MSADQYYSGEGYIEDEPQVYEGNSYAAEPVRVTEVSERAAPEYGATMTWLIPQTTAGTPVQILTRRLRRHKAKLIITGLGGATSVVFSSVIDRLQGATPQGFTVNVVGALPDWESQQPLYAIAVGGGPASISIIDESYAER